jgi:hypothetical protein
VHIAEFLEAPDDERLEQHKCHFFGQTTLMKSYEHGDWIKYRSLPK